ncbi:hypothetical protein HK099_004913 [Clydaea vesicula]|uniref:Uncharacterized protein n=1 Tax=Clydaea vesicula TaxID=447962 RepID=A0AAD5XZX9_9FUNG|nr:hypothetical protein HK099_004913 [Clydaea vesicula]KAJ3378258.1 hypothetical protein HDU92_007554 [Lobulomyces angularis]
MIESLTVVAQNPPLAIIDAKYCKPELVTLELKQKNFQYDDHFTIYDPITKQVYFTLKKKVFTWSETKVLQDYLGNPILHFIKIGSGYWTEHDVYLGEKGDKKLFSISGKYKQKVQFKNLITGEKCELCCRTNDDNYDSIITLDRGCKGKENRETVGMIKRAKKFNFSRDDSYTLIIAPNVDMSMLVLLCITKDELECN